VINGNTVISLALAAGFNAFSPACDGGSDFILHHEADDILRKVQLKSRLTIGRTYIGRDIRIAFPLAGDWYPMPHNAMIELAGALGFAQTASWREGGTYTVPRLSGVGRGLRTMALCQPRRGAVCGRCGRRGW
jgi:hypothetical protein